MSLRKHGAGRGATVAFLLSTPQTGVDSILVTYSLMGPVFAVFRPIAALITGLIGGGLVDLFQGQGVASQGQLQGQDHPQDQGQPQGQECSEDCCNHTKKVSLIVRMIRHGFVTLPRDIGGAMLVGVMIAAVISAVVPDDFFASVLGGGIGAMVIMVFLGVPVYVCATASVPVAVALIAKGLSPGAAFVFLMTGPATNAAAFMTIVSFLGMRTAVIYLLTVAGCAISGGLVIDTMFPALSSELQTHMHQMSPSIFGHISAIVLLAVLIWAIIGKFAAGKHE